MEYCTINGDGATWADGRAVRATISDTVARDVTKPEHQAPCFAMSRQSGTMLSTLAFIHSVRLSPASGGHEFRTRAVVSGRSLSRLSG
jgi:hypothetical protein